jgi:hypothetical protein
LLLLLLCVVCACHVSSQQLIGHHVKHSLLEHVLLAVALQALHDLLGSEGRGKGAAGGWG